MKIPAMIILAMVTCAGQPSTALALDDSAALQGLSSVQAVYDVRTSDEKGLHFIFKVIRDTFDETRQQDIQPDYVVSMRGPTVKLLVRSRAGDAALQQKTVSLIKELQQRGVRLEACGYALNLFGLEPDNLYENIVSIGNSLNSLIGYQIRGYALVPMN